jgi:hypothetical protein
LNLPRFERPRRCPSYAAVRSVNVSLYGTVWLIVWSFWFLLYILKPQTWMLWCNECKQVDGGRALVPSAPSWNPNDRTNTVLSFCLLLPTLRKTVLSVRHDAVVCEIMINASKGVNKKRVDNKDHRQHNKPFKREFRTLVFFDRLVPWTWLPFQTTIERFNPFNNTFNSCLKGLNLNLSTIEQNCTSCTL